MGRALYTCSIKAGKFVPNFSSLRAMLIQGILEHWQHFRFCSNPSCLTPYFVAKRKDQTVCDTEICKAEKQRQHALKWWSANRAKKRSPKEKGEKWRSQNRNKVWHCHFVIDGVRYRQSTGKTDWR